MNLISEDARECISLEIKVEVAPWEQSFIRYDKSIGGGDDSASEAKSLITC